MLAHHTKATLAHPTRAMLAHHTKATLANHTKATLAHHTRAMRAYYTQSLSTQGNLHRRKLIMIHVIMLHPPYKYVGLMYPGWFVDYPGLPGS